MRGRDRAHSGGGSDPRLVEQSLELAGRGGGESALSQRGRERFGRGQILRLPFKLACESDSLKTVAISLATIERLITYGYLDGNSIVDPAVYGSDQSASKDKKALDDSLHAASKIAQSPSPMPGSGPKEALSPHFHSGAATGANGSPATAAQRRSQPDTRRLIGVIVDTFHQCSALKDRDIQLQTLKCVLTAMNSTSCQIHGNSIVHVVLACWQIFESAVDEIIKSTAKASLNQIFNLAYQRMESFALQLKLFEQNQAINPDANQSTAVQSTNTSVQSNSTEKKDEEQMIPPDATNAPTESSKALSPSIREKDEEKVDLTDSSSSSANSSSQSSTTAAESTATAQSTAAEQAARPLQ